MRSKDNNYKQNGIMKLAFFHHLIKSIVMINMVPSNLQTSYQEIERVRSDHHVPDNNVFLLYEMPLDNIPIAHKIYISNLLPYKKDRVIPNYHRYSKFHNQYIYNRYAKMIPYNEYCLMEERVADIIKSYMETKDNYLFIFQNENWLADESVVSYYTQEDRASIDRYFIVDLDSDPTIVQESSSTIYIWNKYNHPHL